MMNVLTFNSKAFGIQRATNTNKNGKYIPRTKRKIKDYLASQVALLDRFQDSEG